jgi:hypothetical protein
VDIGRSAINIHDDHCSDNEAPGLERARTSAINRGMGRHRRKTAASSIVRSAWEAFRKALVTPVAKPFHAARQSIIQRAIRNEPEHWEWRQRGEPKLIHDRILDPEPLPYIPKRPLKDRAIQEPMSITRLEFVYGSIHEIATELNLTSQSIVASSERWPHVVKHADGEVSRVLLARSEHIDRMSESLMRGGNRSKRGLGAAAKELVDSFSLMADECKQDNALAPNGISLRVRGILNDHSRSLAEIGNKAQVERESRNERTLRPIQLDLG